MFFLYLMCQQYKLFHFLNLRPLQTQQSSPLPPFQPMKKSPFIEGFRQPTLSKNSHFLISDIRGDGEGKLVIWSQQQSQLIVYKGSNREIEKPVKLKNVNAIIEYYDEESSTQPVIGLAAENGLYLFRGLMESFRLKVPDVLAEFEQQVIWSQYQDNPATLATQLMNIKPSLLTSRAKSFLSSTSLQHKKQLIEQVFQQGLNQKDSISAIAILKQTQGSSGLGNVVIGTELNRLYILDNYGHKIISERIIDFVPCMIYGYGTYSGKYVIICVSRQGIISMFLSADKNQPSETIKLNTRVNSADLSYPDFAISCADQVISVFSFSGSNLKMSVPKYSLKLNQKPIKILFMKKKSTKLLLVAFQHQFRILREKQTIYRHQTDYKLYSMLYGSFAREEGCLILLYESNGFEVLIGHRLFNPKENYEMRKTKEIQQGKERELQIPKKTPQFLKHWNSQPDTLNNFKLFQRNMALLKWRTLKGKAPQKNTSSSSSPKIQINPKIQGLGPYFIIKLLIQNISNTPIFNLKILIAHEPSSLAIKKMPEQICMLAPFSPILKEIELESLSLKAERFGVELVWGGGICLTVVCVPGCAEMAD